MPHMEGVMVLRGGDQFDGITAAGTRIFAVLVVITSLCLPARKHRRGREALVLPRAARKTPARLPLRVRSFGDSGGNKYRGCC